MVLGGVFFPPFLSLVSSRSCLCQYLGTCIFSTTFVHALINILLLAIHFSLSFSLGILLCSTVSTSQMLFWLLPCCCWWFFIFFSPFHLSFRIVNFWYMLSIPKAVPPVWCRSWMCSQASFRSWFVFFFPSRKELEAAHEFGAVSALPASSLVSRDSLHLPVLERGNVQWQADLPGGWC